MGLGIRLRRLWHLRRGVLACAVLAVLVAVWSVATISFWPPGLTPRKTASATASVHLMVDTPRSSWLDLRQEAGSFETLTKRAVLLGNVMAGSPVRQAIATRARVPVEVLRIDAPLSPQGPSAVEAGDTAPAEILMSEPFGLTIQANATVPLLDIYAQAPTADRAVDLARAAVDESQAHLVRLAASEQTPERGKIRLVSLGEPRVVTVSAGVDWRTSVPVLVVTFTLGCASLIFLGRLKEGWRAAALIERAAAK